MRWTMTVAMAITITVTACESGAATDAGPSDAGVERDAWIPMIDRPAFEAANAVEPGDARYEGQQRFLHDTWGTERLDAWPPTDFMLALMESEPDVFGSQFESFGFVADPNDDLPIGFKRGLEDPSRVHETCALCHVSTLPDGRVWLGLPNGRLDFARFRVEVSARWVAAGHPPLLTPLEAEKALQMGPGRTGAESADYPLPVPADFPTYWELGSRSHLNHLGTSGDIRSEAYLGVFAMGAGAMVDGTIVVPFPAAARIDPFVAFMAAIPAPDAPAGDAVAIAAGRAVFEREGCDTCHRVGDPAAVEITTYDRAVDGRERLPGDDTAFPRGSIRTSYAHRTLIDGDPDAGTGSDDGFAEFFRFIVRNGLTVGTSDGYRTADLRGLWATAPYLHNGSVPTIEDLLRPAAERPPTFMRGERLVDTTLAGNGNQGHEFGIAISEAERTSLAAYLRSL